MLGSHGLFTWGDTAYESYINTLEVIERCAQYLEENPYWERKGSVFGGASGWSRLPSRKSANRMATAPFGPRPPWLLFLAYKDDRAFYR